MKKIVVSGMRPTGRLHLGHLVGSLENFLKLQDNDAYQCYFFVADWHATTDSDDWSRIGDYSHSMLRDWIAAGIDPERVTIFRQSRIPQHLELLVMLSSITPVPWLTRTPSYKEKLQAMESEEERVSMGFLQYPLLQAADILVYRGQLVPVGDDQLPHLELCREIVRRFHHRFGTEIFPEPQPLLTSVSRLSGLDGRKMSKSLHNTIDLCEPLADLSKKVREMVTDPARVRRTDPGNPEVCSVFSYHKVFNQEESSEISSECVSAAIGCVDCKNRLLKRLERVLEPFREISTAELDTEEIFRDGERAAREKAAETMEIVKRASGVGA